MVHQYKNNGYDIVLDVNSGAIHVVDDVTYDVIEMIDQSQPESYARDEIVSALSGFQKTPDGCQGTLPAYCT